MSEMDIDKATTPIPVCTVAKNLSEFINTCDIAGAFEHRASERTLTIGLNFAITEENENVTSFASEKLYYNLCTEGSEDMSKEESKEQIEQMERDDIIEKSMSPFNAPLLLVKKKADASGKEKFRIVIDFKALNNVTINEFHPLPNITEILDQELTTFSTNQGHYHYKRMSMGLASAPSTFAKAMTNVMAGLIGIKCLVYLDDIIIYGKNLNDHNKKLIDVFERLRHIISEHGIKPDPNKIVSVMNFPAPKNVKQIKSILGLTSYYRKFINNYSSIANPMTNFLKKDVKFNWDDKCQQAFDKLKTILCSEPILQYPDFKKEFILTTDASGKALGAILSQGKIGSDLPISYASRTLNNAELNYSTTELECLAIIFGVKQFRPYLYVIAKSNLTGNYNLLKSEGRPEGIMGIFGRNILTPLAVPVSIVASMTFGSRFSITNLVPLQS
ncbi:hypothetical protein QTP88_006639 [Uroleucon formosanum]